MSFKYKFGDEVRVKSLPCGTEEDVAIGDIAIVVEVDEDDDCLTYKLSSNSWSNWWFSDYNLKSHLNTREDVIEEIRNTQCKLAELHKLLETFA